MNPQPSSVQWCARFTFTYKIFNNEAIDVVHNIVTNVKSIGGWCTWLQAEAYVPWLSPGRLMANKLLNEHCILLIIFADV